MSKHKDSKIFEGFRALGLYSSHVAHSTRYHKRHKEHYIFVPVGKVFHSYNCSKLGITQVSNSHPGDIACIASDSFLVYTACGKVVRAFQHNRQVKYIYKGHDDDVHLLLPFSEHLITIDKSSALKIWHIHTQELFLEIDFSNASFQITAIVHPSTYVNKILLGSKQGKLQLWNIRKSKMLYEFPSPNEPSSVLCLVQSPAVDVIGIGYSNGDISMHNIRVDHVVLKFKQESGPVLGLAFRTDGATTLVSSSPLGNITVWDLEENRILGVMEHSHGTAIAGMTFIHGQPTLVTNAADNSIKMWAFDQSDGKGRLLRLRAGHSAPPTKIRFYDEDGGNILSAGLDSTLQSFSTQHEEKNKSLGQASMNRAMARKKPAWLDERKLPPIMDFCCRTTRAGDWDNIIAFHNRHPIATTWNYQNCRMGSHKLLHDRFKSKSIKGNNVTSAAEWGLHATSVTLTDCGNFCLVGYRSGYVDVYNIQSGIYKGSFVDPKNIPSETAHSKAVTGIAVDALQQVAVTTALDKTLKFWKFKSRLLLKTIEMQSQPAVLNLHNNSSMLAIALDNFSLKIYDLETKKLVRQFPGHQGMITDLAWSSDSRWLVSSSMDCTIKTWDMPTASLVDCFLVDSPATTISFSPTLELLATCHVDDLGIYLWSNRAIFTAVSLQPLPQDFHPIDVVDLPGTVVHDSSMTCTDDKNGGENDAEEDGSAESSEYESKEQCDPSLITLSLLPNSRWANLINLDTIKKRNKPKEPPTAPKSAPFFLPTIAGINPKFDLNKEEGQSKIIERTIVKPMSEFAAKLLENAAGDYFLVMSEFKKLGPSALDMEIRSLSPDNGGSLDLMHAFLSFTLNVMKSRKDFELVQAYLGVCLKVHSEFIASQKSLLPVLEKLKIEQQKAWGEARRMMDQSLCLVNYIKTATL